GVASGIWSGNATVNVGAWARGGSCGFFLLQPAPSDNAIIATKAANWRPEVITSKRPHAGSYVQRRRMGERLEQLLPIINLRRQRRDIRLTSLPVRAHLFRCG